MDLSCTAGQQQAVRQVLEDAHFTSCATVAAIFSKYLSCVQTLYTRTVLILNVVLIK
jgi:hypothetical protein